MADNEANPLLLTILKNRLFKKYLDAFEFNLTAVLSWMFLDDMQFNLPNFFLYFNLKITLPPIFFLRYLYTHETYFLLETSF